MSVDQVDDVLNRDSGLKGLAGTSDMRDLFAQAEAGDQASLHAIEVWSWRAKHYLGAYLAQLGGLDAIVFTGGIGENQAVLRAKVLDGLEGLGIALDPSTNSANRSDERLISSPESDVSVWVIPTNEELQIARLSAECVGV